MVKLIGLSVLAGSYGWIGCQTLLVLRNVNYHMTAPDILTCSRN
jgi:hypothetical protein